VFFLALVALMLSACGAINVKSSSYGGLKTRGRVDDPRASHVPCLRAAGLPIQEIGMSDLVVGNGISVHFDASVNGAQEDQIRGQAPGAEVIGNALLYPGQAPDGKLGAIEGCLDIGVKG
jgi:hypothetical protein